MAGFGDFQVFAMKGKFLNDGTETLEQMGPLFALKSAVSIGNPSLGWPDPKWLLPSQFNASLW